MCSFVFCAVIPLLDNMIMSVCTGCGNTLLNCGQYSTMLFNRKKKYPSVIAYRPQHNAYSFWPVLRLDVFEWSRVLVCSVLTRMDSVVHTWCIVAQCCAATVCELYFLGDTVKLQGRDLTRFQ